MPLIPITPAPLTRLRQTSRNVYILYRHRWNTRIFPLTKIWYPVKTQFFFSLVKLSRFSWLFQSQPIGKEHHSISPDNKQNARFWIKFVSTRGHVMSAKYLIIGSEYRKRFYITVFSDPFNALCRDITLHSALDLLHNLFSCFFFKIIFID